MSERHVGRFGTGQEFTRVHRTCSESFGSNENLRRSPRAHKIPTEELVVAKRLSKMPNEYRNLVPQAIAARHLLKEGGTVHAGQSVSFVMTRNESKIPENRTLPAELIDSTTSYDAESYVDLVLSSATNLLLPFNYDLKSLRKLV